MEEGWGKWRGEDEDEFQYGSINIVNSALARESKFRAHQESIKESSFPPSVIIL
jgi:hypothetical protein